MVRRHALWLLFALVLAAFAAPSQQQQQRGRSLQATYRASLSRCRLGAEGVLVSVKGPSSAARSSRNGVPRGAAIAFADKLVRLGEARGRRLDPFGPATNKSTVRVLHVMTSLVEIVAAEIDDEPTMAAVMEDEDVELVEANCRISLDDPREEQQHDEQQQQQQHDDDEKQQQEEKEEEQQQEERQQTTTASTTALTTSQPNAPWGLDRIDSRTGLGNVATPRLPFAFFSPRVLASSRPAFQRLLPLLLFLLLLLHLAPQPPLPILGVDSHRGRRRLQPRQRARRRHADLRPRYRSPHLARGLWRAGARRLELWMPDGPRGRVFVWGVAA